MKCAYCGSRIGMLRKFRDRRYCSDEHRRMMVAKSSRVARDDTRFHEWDEPWAPLTDLGFHYQKTGQRGTDYITTGAVTILLLTFLFAAVATDLPRLAAPSPFKRVGELSAAPTSVSSWTAMPVAGGSLRLWPASVGYRNYRFSFTAVLGDSALGWVVRATDPKNYVAMRLVHGSDGYRLQRSAVIGGIEGAKTASELIPGLSLNKPVSVSVENHEQSITTKVNGKIVDVWSDPRLSSGGAGILTARAQEPRLESVQLTLLDKRSPVELGYWYLPGTFLGVR